MPGMTTPVKEKKPSIKPETPKRDAGIHNGIRGDEYQIYVTMYILLRAYNDHSEHGQDFKLRMEPTDPLVGEFDDIWLEMGNEHVLIQVKYNSDSSNLTESVLRPRSEKNDTFSLYKYKDAFEKCKQVKRGRESTGGEKWSYVLLTNKPVGDKETPMFVEYSSDTVLTPRIFASGKFLKIAKDDTSDEFHDNFIIAAALPNLANLRREIEAEIKKTNAMEFMYGFHFLRDELFNWVCMKTNRNDKYIDRKWVQEMFGRFCKQQNEHWEIYEDDILATVKISLQMCLCQNDQIGAIEETAIALNNKLKYMFTTGRKDATQDNDESKQDKSAAKNSVGSGIFEQLRKNNQYQNIVDESSAINQIFTLRQILQISREFREKDTHHLFIFLKNDYETEKCDELLNLLEENGVRTKLFTTEMRSGTLNQEDLRMLLNFAIKCALKRAGLNMHGSIFEKSRLVLCHGNEVDIIGKTIKDVETQYLTLKGEAKKVGLIIDASETKYMLAGVKNKTGSKTNAGGLNWLKEDKIKTTKAVLFLGSLVTWDNNCSKEIERCIKIGECSYNNRKETLRSDTLDFSKKWSIYENEIRPNVLYGCEAWTMLSKEEERLKKFDTKMQKEIATGYGGPNACREHIENVIISKQVQWAEQVARMPNNEPARRAVIEASFPDPENKRRNGFAKKRWFEAIEGHEKEQDLCDVWALVEKELKPPNYKA